MNERFMLNLRAACARFGRQFSGPEALVEVALGLRSAPESTVPEEPSE